MGIQSWNIDSGEQSGGITPHASTHQAGGTDPISAEAIGAEVEGAAVAEMLIHLNESDPHPQYQYAGGTGTYNIINSSAFVEEFDDFLSLSPLNKLGWTGGSANGWAGAEAGNRFPGTIGVFTLGILGLNQSTGDYSHLRLGNFPVKPLLSEGYSNIEISGVVGLANAVQTDVGWASRFGLLDTGAGFGINFSILISAEFFNGGYNWIAIWRSGDGTTGTQVITPVVGNLATKVFALKIKIDCENNQITFEADGVGCQVNIAPSNWLFGAMAPIFVIQRAAVATDTQNRAFWVDKYLFCKNVVNELPPSGNSDVEWAEITNPPETANRWPTWAEVTSKPTTFTPSAHTHPWSDIVSPPVFTTRWPTWNETTDKPIAVSGGSININNGTGWLNISLGAQGYTFQVGSASTGDPLVIFEVFKPGTGPSRLQGIVIAEADLNYAYGSGWGEYSTTYLARYRRMDKEVKCQGLVRRTTTSGTLIATLPSGFRPNGTRLFGCQSSQGYTRVDINPSGQILLVSPNPAATITWISLDGISFFTS